MHPVTTNINLYSVNSLDKIVEGCCLRKTKKIIINKEKEKGKLSLQQNKLSFKTKSINLRNQAKSNNAHHRLIVYSDVTF
jgi:hypothetical protein